jgi:uncharacterized protein YndB with AHSA1/START domain
MKVTYVRATPDKVWEALTKADLTEKYWFGYRVSAEGPSGMQAHHDPILESDPPRRLVYS